MVLPGAQQEKQRGAFQENVSLITLRSSPVEETEGETTLLNIVTGHYSFLLGPFCVY